MRTPQQTTLLTLVQAVSDYARTDDEIVATVAYLVNSRKVLLCGNFAGAKIDLSPAASKVLRTLSIAPRGAHNATRAAARLSAEAPASIQ